MNEQDIERVLRENLFASICTFPRCLFELKRLNITTLMKYQEKLSTMHCFRFGKLLIEKLGISPNDVDEMLLNVYAKAESMPVFYFIAYLSVIYFKRTQYTISRRIIKILQTILMISNRCPISTLLVYFPKKRVNLIAIGGQALVSIKVLSQGLQCFPDERYKKLKKHMEDAKNLEWIPQCKSIQIMDSLCNFVYRYDISNRILQNSQAKFLTDELFYPKPWLDFAYSLKQRMFTELSTRRFLFELIKNVLCAPEPFQNLSFAHYIKDILNCLCNQIKNKVIILSKSGCFCHTKCTKREKDLDRLYDKCLFILCKSCNRPVNYRYKKLYNKVFITNEVQGVQNYVSCIDGCSNFEAVDLYKCFIDENGQIQYHVKGLLRIENKKRYITTLCAYDRLCQNIVTLEANNEQPLFVKCSSKHTDKIETCFDQINDFISEQTGPTEAEDFVRRSMCAGCLAHCFDICTKNNKCKQFVRRILKTSL